MTIPRIETARLTLRPLTLDDAPDLHAAVFGDEAVMRYLPGGGMARTLRQAERAIDYYADHWARHGYGTWGVVLRDDSRLIGYSGLNFIPEFQDIEVLAVMARAVRDNGYEVEAAQAALRYGFLKLNLRKIIALVHPSNREAHHMARRLSMQYHEQVKLLKMKLDLYSMSARQFKPGDDPYELIG
jgi:RimJ/RimL family protein N-acetyltransferase